MAPRTFRVVAWIGFWISSVFCPLLAIAAIGITLPTALAGVWVWGDVVSPYDNRLLAILSGAFLALLGLVFGVSLAQYRRMIRLLEVAGWVGAQRVMMWQAGIGSVAIFSVLIAIDKTSELASFAVLFGFFLSGGVGALFVQPHIANLEIEGARQSEPGEALTQSREREIEARLERIEAAIAEIPSEAPPPASHVTPWWRQFLSSSASKGRRR